MASWGYGAVTHGTVSAGTASSSILSANPDRKYALIQNDGTVDVYMALGTPALSNFGIRLVAGGGSYEMSRGAANVFSGAINVITSVAGQKVLYTEGE